MDACLHVEDITAAIRRFGGGTVMILSNVILQPDNLVTGFRQQESQVVTQAFAQLGLQRFAFVVVQSAACFGRTSLRKSGDSLCCDNSSIATHSMAIWCLSGLLSFCET